jgi:hypothetical protein
MRQHATVLLWLLLTGLLLSTVTLVAAAGRKTPPAPRAPIFWQPRDYQPTPLMREQRAQAHSFPSGRLICHPTKPLLTTPSR